MKYIHSEAAWYFNSQITSYAPVSKYVQSILNIPVSQHAPLLHCSLAKNCFCNNGQLWMRQKNLISRRVFLALLGNFSWKCSCRYFLQLIRHKARKFYRYKLLSSLSIIIWFVHCWTFLTVHLSWVIICRYQDLSFIFRYLYKVS